MSYKILVADDEGEIRDLLHLYLEKDGYEVFEAEDGAAAAAVLEKESIDLAILDIMMPKIDGFHLIKKIRETSSIPIMVLSAKVGDNDKILGLDLGADDYITKPFNPLEVVARVNSNIRRFWEFGKGTSIKEKLKVQDLELDLDACVLMRGEETIDLTSVEFRLMKMFMENPGRVFTKQQIFECGWEEEYVVADNNIMVCISKLRSKLSENSNEYIKTIRGLGYRMEK